MGAKNSDQSVSTDWSRGVRPTNKKKYMNDSYALVTYVKCNT